MGKERMSHDHLFDSGPLKVPERYHPRNLRLKNVREFDVALLFDCQVFRVLTNIPTTKEAACVG